MISRTFFACFTTLLLLGCSSSPKTHYYTFNTPPDARIAATGPLILIGPVTLPDLVDRPQLVLRSNDNQVEISDTHRWAQSLKSEIARALAANLALEVDAPRVYLLGQTLGDEADLRIALDILRFESAPASHTTIEAQWSVRLPRAPLATSNSKFEYPAATAWTAAMAPSASGARPRLVCRTTPVAFSTG